MLCVPDLNTNLILVTEVTDWDYYVKFHKDGGKIYEEEGQVRMEAIRRGDGNIFHRIEKDM